MRYGFIVLLGTLLVGCGPVMSPFLIKLKPEEQKIVDSEWENMFTPSNRLDRDLLLDVLTAQQELQLGFDRLHVTGEKYFTSGRAVVEADFDRGNPDSDQLTITLYDLQGRTTRRERYGRKEIKARWDEMSGDRYYHIVARKEGTVETPEQRELRLEMEKRVKRIQGATQPAVVQ
jgi:hypothetical protein